MIYRNPKINIIEKWANALIISSNAYSMISKQSLEMPHIDSGKPEEEKRNYFNNPPMQVRQEFIESLSKNIDIREGQSVKTILSPMYNKVEEFLLNNGYIQPNTDHGWQLTNKGELLKELGSHRAYIIHRTREINILKRQHHINIGLISVGLIAAAMPFVVALIFPPKIIVQSLPSPVIIHNDTVRLHQPSLDTVIKSQSTPQPQVKTKQLQTKPVIQ